MAKQEAADTARTRIKNTVKQDARRSMTLPPSRTTTNPKSRKRTKLLCYLCVFSRQRLFHVLAQRKIERDRRDHVHRPPVRRKRLDPASFHSINRGIGQSR